MDHQPTRVKVAASPLAKLGLRGNYLLYFISCFASLGVFLFGYDQGVMSGILTGPYFKAYFHQPTSYELGTMVAILEIGAMITSLACGKIADILGRRRTLFYGAAIFVIGGAVQTAATGFQVMVVGRIIAGFGVGILSMIVPIYQSEISPAEHRGKLACIEFTGNIIGYCSSVWVDYGCSFISSDLSWRIPLSIQCFIGGILAFGSVLLPESPRWLLDTDRDEEGMVVLADLHGGGRIDHPKAKEEFREIKENVLASRAVGDRSYKSMWKRYKSRVLIAMSSMFFAQLNGINVISYYAPLVFESAGWIGRDAVFMTGINGIIYVLSTIPTWYLVDIWGRRPILLSGAVFMAIPLALTGWFIFLDEPYTPHAVVLCVIIYNAAFGYSWGPIPWLLPPEIMPLPFRAQAVSISTGTNWFANWVVGEITPPLRDAIGWRLYLMHAFFCCCSFLVVYFTYPETKGVPLEEMDELFGDQAAEDEEDGDEDEDEEDLIDESESLLSGSGTGTGSVSRSVSRDGSVERPGASGSRGSYTETRRESDGAGKRRSSADGLASNARGWWDRLMGRGKRPEERETYEPLR